MIGYKKIKVMWILINNYLNFPFYGIENIEKFLERKSSSIFTKIKSNIRTVFVFQTLGILFLIMDIVFYYPDLYIFSLSVAALLVLLVIIKYEFDTLQTISNLQKTNKNVQESLNELHDFILRNKLKMVLSYISTNVFIFPAGLIFYFFLLYGQIKLFPIFGYIVFGIIHLLMIIGAFIIQNSQLDFHQQHIKACIEDFDDQEKMLLSNRIEEKQKQDVRLKIMVIAIILIVLIVFIAILKKNGVG